jgi:hypothetical protein
MNFGATPNPPPTTPNLPRNNVGKATTSFFSDVFTKYWAILLIILVLFVAIVIYHKVIGYYIDIGWKKLWIMMGRGDSVEVIVGDEAEDAKPILDMSAKPINTSAPPPSVMLKADERPLGIPGAIDKSLEAIMPSLTAQTPNEVFNVSRNIYTFNDAAAVCAAMNSELATFEQVQEAHKDGADWCNYGWVKGQMAVYPTQKETWEKLQKGSPEYRNVCGQPGVNGGYFDNPELRFGVNCYGLKPPKSAVDELNESSVALPQNPEEIEFDKRVQRYRDQLNTMIVLPFSRGKWTV